MLSHVNSICAAEVCLVFYDLKPKHKQDVITPLVIVKWPFSCEVLFNI